MVYYRRVILDSKTIFILSSEKARYDALEILYLLPRVSVFHYGLLPIKNIGLMTFGVYNTYTLDCMPFRDIIRHPCVLNKRLYY